MLAYSQLFCPALSIDSKDRPIPSTISIYFASPRINLSPSLPSVISCTSLQALLRLVHCTTPSSKIFRDSPAPAPPHVLHLLQLLHYQLTYQFFCTLSTSWTHQLPSSCILFTFAPYQHPVSTVYSLAPAPVLHLFYPLFIACTFYTMLCRLR